MSTIFDKSTLEYYNYWEQNNFEPVEGIGYSVKVSDREGNIITIEKDGSLFAMVGLTLSGGVLTLIDKAHDDASLAEIEFPNAGHIDNCHFDEENSKIIFDIITLNGTVETVELDVESLVDIYEAGQGIEIGEKNAETGKKPISIKLASGEDILQLSDEGLSISDKIATDDELAQAVSGKADITYVDDLFGSISGVTSGITELEDEIEKIKGILGTEDDDPNIDERIDSKADLDEFNDLEDEVGELIVKVETISGDVDSLEEKVDGFDDRINDLTDEVIELKNDVTSLSGTVDVIDDMVEELSGNVENNKVSLVKITSGLPTNVKESYILQNKVGEQLGDRIDIYNDSTIENIEYSNVDDTGKEGQFLKITYIRADGQRTVSYIDISEMVIESEFDKGLEVVDGVVSIKIDPTSDGYLTVSSDGLKLSGIFQQFVDLINVNQQQWDAITNEATARESVDSQLWQAINTEATLRESGDTKLHDDIEAEATERAAKDDELRGLIETETANRISGDAIVSGAVVTEKERAEVAETELRTMIESETANRISGDDAITSDLEEEIAERKAADNQIRQDFADEINNVNISINGVRTDLAEETAERIREDNEIKDEITTFRELYAKKEYVDSKDAEAIITSVTSATTLAAQYSDLKDDYLRQELKLYCDSGHTELQNAISDNATKINDISNLKGVSGSDTSNYDNSGNGILDVLHREFHQYKGETIHNATGAQIKNVDEVAIGRYNISNRETDGSTGADIPSGCTIFSIGIGTSDSVRRNALEVRQDGSVYMWIEGAYMKVNDLLGMLAHETY